MPVKVWKKVVRIQREFLWGGVRGGNKVSWVKWAVVCKDKSKGGLGVRDVRIVNLSLLAKWRWRLLLPGRALWKDVLVAQYGSHILSNVDWSSFRVPTMASKWWKDICSIDKAVGSKNWLVESLVSHLGNGNSTYFWTSNWIGEAPLSGLFPRLFSLSNHKESTVKDLCVLVGERWTWNFSWRRALFLWEEDLVVRLREVLASANLSCEDDGWSWLPDPDGVFTARKGFLMIWHATLWSLWKARNGAIFANGSFIPKVIVNEIKVMS
ncbi:hypothetical protein TSUD_362760 [Trifolium subterraneum]|uniref:Reverse transcriptase zinc-binding domain-containing protein n=1 Tax=Trifolium subterraneum TaxID=3900 RepID=A0A2Z6N972_TRISU|nr:hypothetical protein TSUD_362760 [Trifolium subterraneum]